MEMLDYRSFMTQAIFIFLLGWLDSTNGGFQRPGNGYNSLSGGLTTLNPLSSLVHPKWSDPYFDLMMPQNVTALVGQSAYLSCRVKNLGNKTVSWIRHRDIHILTVVTYTYTTDQRFQTTHHKDTDEWTLHIKYAQLRDIGMYECQVSSQPIKSFYVYLSIVEPYKGEGGGYYGSSYRPPQGYRHRDEFLNSYQQDHHHDSPSSPQQNHHSSQSDIYNRMYSDRFYVPTTTILGGPELYVDKGSTINLTCTIKFSPEPPGFIFWYHEDAVVSYESSRGGITIRLDHSDPTISYLLIQNADLGDTGKYTCAPSNAPRVSVKVHVLNGERPEAMQTGTSSYQKNHTIGLILFLNLYRLIEYIINYNNR